jgi:hypothetical protein
MQAPEQWAWSIYCSYAYGESMEADNLRKANPAERVGLAVIYQDVVPAEIAQLIGGA